jgi:hypothetical protein
MIKNLYTAFKTMRFLVVGLLQMMLTAALIAQTPTAGDYRTLGTDNWSVLTNWVVRDGGGSWSTPTALPTASSNVYIQSGHTITVDVAATCNALQMCMNNATATAGNPNPGRLVLISNLSLNGKMRAYTDANGADLSTGDNAFYSGQTSATSSFSTTAATSSPGLLRIVGNSRTIFTTGEWNASGFGTCDVEFNLNNGSTAGTETSFKFRNIIVANGTTVDASINSSSRIQADEVDGLGGNITIKSGGKIISARSGTTSQVFCGTSSTTKCNTVTIENGGTLELTGTTPSIDCVSFVNNGTVAYTKAGTQTLLQRGATTDGTTAFNSYSTLIIGNTSTKTPFAPITVSNLLLFLSTATASAATLGGATAALSVTMLNGSTIERNSSATTPLPSTVGAVFFGTSASDLINVTYSYTGAILASSNEHPSISSNPPSPGKIGTTTVATGATYRFTGSRNTTNLVLNGTLSLLPTTTMTLTINGDISGSGSIAGSASASIAFGGTNNGSAGTLNFASGSQNANIITINRTGSNPSVNLGTPVVVNGNLNLTSGKLVIGANDISVVGTVSGSSAGYVVTNGSGVLKRLATGSNRTTFHIGTTDDYLPVSLTNNGVSDDFSAKVALGPLACVSAANRISPVWTISEGVAGGSIDTVRLEYNNTALRGSGYNPSIAKAIQCNGSSVVPNNGATGEQGSGPYFSIITEVSSFGTFGIGNDPTIPVELMSFEVKKDKNAALLTWKTASERNNAAFNIEHSTNGIDFQTIGQVKGNGTTAAATTYNFEHQTPSVSVNYYRLKQIDTDGKTTLSAVRSVVFGPSGLIIKTTLVQDALDIVVSDEKIGPLSIFNLSGQEVMCIQAQGAQRLMVNELRAGLYIVRTAAGDVGRFVKQ